MASTVRGNPLAVGDRVRHQVSKTTGVVTDLSTWYAHVRFDGDDHSSWVARDSMALIRKDKRDGATD